MFCKKGMCNTCFQACVTHATVVVMALLAGVLIRDFKGFSRELAVRECSDCLRVLDKGFSREFAVRECSDCLRVLDKGFSR